MNDVTRLSASLHELKGNMPGIVAAFKWAIGLSLGLKSDRVDEAILEKARPMGGIVKLTEELYEGIIGPISEAKKSVEALIASKVVFEDEVDSLIAVLDALPVAAGHYSDAEVDSHMYDIIKDMVMAGTLPQAREVVENGLGLVGDSLSAREALLNIYRVAAERILLRTALTSQVEELGRAYENLQSALGGIEEKRGRLMAAMDAFRAQWDSQEITVHHRAVAVIQAALKTMQSVNSDIDKFFALVDRLSRGQNELVIEEADISAFIHERARFMSNRFMMKGIALQTTAIEGGIRLATDKGLLKGIIDTVLENAAHYTPEGGRVEIALRRDEAAHEAVISVCDTGPGIPVEHQQRIWQAYERASDKPGTGLGLYIVKTNTELLGGRVGLESEAGAGATFTIRLPLF